MAPNFSKLVLKFWKLVSEQKYTLTARKYALTARKYALTARNYSLASWKDFKRLLLRDFWTIFGFMAHPPHRGFTMIPTFYPQFNLSCTSFVPLLYLILTPPQPAISNHGLETNHGLQTLGKCLSCRTPYKTSIRRCLPFFQSGTKKGHKPKELRHNPPPPRQILCVWRLFRNFSV